MPTNLEPLNTQELATRVSAAIVRLLHHRVSGLSVEIERHPAIEEGKPGHASLTFSINLESAEDLIEPYIGYGKAEYWLMRMMRTELADITEDALQTWFVLVGGRLLYHVHWSIKPERKNREG